MASHALVATLTAAAAMAGGTAAHWLWSAPVATIGAAALAAGAAGMLRRPAASGVEARANPGVRPHPIAEGTARTGTGADRAVLDALPIGLMLIDPDRTIRFANRSFSRILERPDASGSDVSILRINRLTERIEQALGQKSGSTLDFALARGDAWLKAHVRPLPGGGALVALEDETQRRRAEEVHRDFVANASHELKTPLAAVSGIIETLLGHAKTDPEASERFLALLQSQIVRMTRLINDLMSLNRIELNARMQPDEALHLVDIVAETIDGLAAVAAQAGIELKFEREGTDVTVNGNREELSQLFANLVDNAIKYSGPGTTVRIHAERAIDEPGMVGVVVADQGIGIEREHLPRLTERFYRVNIRRSREVGGTGLGLAIVKHILNRHRGRLGVESEPGRGTRFTVWLPVPARRSVGNAEPAVAKPSQN